MLRTYIYSDCGVFDSDTILSCGHINIANEYDASNFRVKAEQNVARLYGKCDMNQKRMWRLIVTLGGGEETEPCLGQ